MMLLQEIGRTKRELKTDELISLLKEKVNELRSSERWRKYLEFISKVYYEYSFANTILIHLQKIDATLVRGYQTWKSLGRWVKKGEKAIWIFAPVIYKKKVKTVEVVTDPETGQPKIDPETGQPVTVEVEKFVDTLTGFTPVPVFDISQTEGKELPCINEVVRTLTTSTMEERYKTLIDAIQLDGIPVGETPELPEEVRGVYSEAKNKILINSMFAVDQKFKTLLHEYAHAWIRTRNIKKEVQEKEKRVIHENEEEVIVESVAFVIANMCGLDTSQYSAGYIAVYMMNAKADYLYTDLSIINKIVSELKAKLEKVVRVE